MTWIADHWLHLVFLLIYLALIARHAFIARSHVAGLDDFLIAGRRMGGGVIALSFYATFMSTNTFIGAAGESWDAGFIWCLGGVVLASMCCLSWFVVAPRFVPLTRKYHSLTVADFLGHRYDSLLLRRLAGGIITFASVVYLVAIYRGAALSLEEMLDVPYAWAIVMVFVVVTLYTLLGGFESVVMTDALQGLLMIGGAIGIAFALWWHGGGYVAMWQNIKSQNKAWVSWDGGMTLATVLALNLSVGIKYLVEPRQLARFYGLKDNTALRRAAILSPIFVILTYICLLPVGVLAHAIIPADAISSSDQVVPYLMASGKLFGPVLGVLFLLVLISAAMSSIDSVLLVAASSMDHDLIAPHRTGHAAVRMTRIWVVVLSLVSMGIALSPRVDNIMAVTAFSGALYGACFFPALVIGIYWARPGKLAAIVSLLGGSISVIGWAIARNLKWTTWHEVYVGLAVGLGLYGVLGVFGPRSEAEAAAEVKQSPA